MHICIVAQKKVYESNDWDNLHKIPAFPILGKDGLYFLQVYRSKIQYIKLFLIVKKSAVQTDSTFQSVEKDRFKVFVHLFQKVVGT